MKHTQILSIVVVVNQDNRQALTALNELQQAVTKLDILIETVVVVNTSNPEILSSIRELSEQAADLQAYVLKMPVDYSTALFAGLENTIGDWVVTFELGVDQPQAIGQMFDTVIREHTEVVLGIDDTSVTQKRNPAIRVLSFLFHTGFRLLHGYSLKQEAPQTKLMSRTVVNHLLNHHSPLIAMETSAATDGYKKSKIKLKKTATDSASVFERIYVRWRTLIGANTVPLRLAHLLCGVSAVLAVLYSIYVVIIYVEKKDIAPGWTTISIMISVMFFMLSLVLWLLSEYMISRLDSRKSKPRYEIIEEFTSKTKVRLLHLNVETEY